ncbi:hypothetical protein [Nitrococcus mobilis]|uniref:Uncharacterized protein n=1 Tax=Nitrococcus mobilis Nb-231 TaxID=314278 RepID=A4BRL8_9GAMM|nr:hypothetical protein [Nitrococcus mobilis]EAR21589.1 hypothetical protein NB231_02443 [Nitrococcus mobilis Nb-231]
MQEISRRGEAGGQRPRAAGPHLGALIVGLAVGAFFGGTTAQATEPQQPIRFLEQADPGRGVLKQTDNKLSVVIGIDPNEVGNVTATHVLYSKGRPVSKSKAPLEFERQEAATDDEGPGAVAILPLRTDTRTKMDDGVYAQKIIVTGALKGDKETVRPIEVERWVYFRVAKGKLTPASLTQYSRFIERPEPAVGPEGQTVLVEQGAAAEDAAGAQQTQEFKPMPESFDQPLGRTGEGASERLNEERQYRQKADMSEANED